MVIARVFLLLLLVFLAAASVAVSAAPAASADITTEAYVRRLTQATRTAWPVLAGLHPGIRAFAEIQLLVSDGRRAWVMDAQGGREVEMSAVRALGVTYEYQRYRKTLWQGRPAIFVGLGDVLPARERQRLKRPQAVPELFALATHEAFHFHVEDGWRHLPGAQRSIAYPASAEPRLYRNLIIRQLLAAVRGQSEALAQASHWYRRWLDEHADEALRLRQVDRSEGSARHVETIAGLLAQGVRPNSAQWSQRMLEALARHGQEDYLAADLESYVLGDLAGYLLERQGVDWLSRVAEGETLLAILLGAVAPLAAPVEEATERRIRKAVAAANHQAAQALEPFLRRFNDPAGGRLLLPNRAMAGSFEVGDAYHLAGHPGTIEVGVRAGFMVNDGRVELHATTVATQLKSTCGREDLYWILALTPAELGKTVDGRLRVERADLSLDLPYPQRSLDEPQAWCVAA